MKQTEFRIRCWFCQRRFGSQRSAPARPVRISEADEKGMMTKVISSMAQLAGTSARRNERSGQGAVRTQVCASRPTNEARSKRRLTRNCTSAR